MKTKKSITPVSMIAIFFFLFASLFMTSCEEMMEELFPDEETRGQTEPLDSLSTGYYEIATTQSDLQQTDF